MSIAHLAAPFQRISVWNDTATCSRVCRASSRSAGEGNGSASDTSIGMTAAIVSGVSP